MKSSGGYAGVVPFVLVAALLAPVGARADDATESRLQFELGVQLMERRRYVDALEHFIASHRLVPNGRSLANAGYCYERLGRRDSAYNAYSSALRLGLPDERRTAVARRRLTRLESRVARIDVDVEPANVSLYLDEIELGSVGTGPGVIAIRADATVLIARLDGYATARVPISPRIGSVESVELRLEPLRAPLLIVTEPAGATIVRVSDGVALGTTPFSESVVPGRMELRLELDGHRSVQRLVEVGISGGANWTVELERDPTKWAAIQVEGRPPGASVVLDGSLELGTLPLSHDTLSLGTHQLRVEADGHDPWEAPVVLEGGGTTRVDVWLRDPRSAPKEGFLWVGYGTGAALLATALGTGIAAGVLRRDIESSRNPDPSDLDRLDTLNLTTDVLWITGAVALLATAIADLLLAEPKPSSATVELDR